MEFQAALANGAALPPTDMLEWVEVKLEVGIESSDQDVLGALFEAPFGILEDDVLFGSAVDEVPLPGTEGDDDRQIGRSEAAPDGSGRGGDPACSVAPCEFDPGGPAALGPGHIARRAADDLNLEGGFHGA